MKAIDFAKTVCSMSSSSYEKRLTVKNPNRIIIKTSGRRQLMIETDKDYDTEYLCWTKIDGANKSFGWWDSQTKESKIELAQELSDWI